MATYKYIAQTTEGRKVRGTMEAANMEELHQNLKDGHLFLISAKEKKDRRLYRPHLRGPSVFSAVGN